MTHIDADALALIALGDEMPSATDRAHLDDCRRCAEELDALRHTVQLGRAGGATELIDPPADVWTRVRTELGLTDDSSRTETPLHRVGRRRRTSARSRRWVPVAAVALVLGLAAGAGGGIWWQTAQQTPSGIAIAGAELTPFPDWPDARGSAVVEQDADGRRQVVVDVDPQTDSDRGSASLREVWLIRSDGTGLVSIGFLDGPEGRFDVPAGIDLAQYSLVDISAETDDGDPTHSGDSIVRGELRAL